MTGKQFLAAFVFVYLSSAACAATWEGGEALGDPWKGFPLGSTATIREEYSESGKPAAEPSSDALTVTKVESDGGVKLRFLQSVGDKVVRRGNRSHIIGADPDDVGLKLAKAEKSSLKIGDQDYEVLVKVWENDPDSKRLELLQKPFPEILKQGGLKGADGLIVRFTVYEATNPDIAIPYHEISRPGADLAIGPRVLKFVYEELSGEHKNVLAETVTDLAATEKIGGREISCIQIENSGAMHRAGAEEAEAYTGNSWYSNEVPGRLVRQELIAGERTMTSYVESFSIPEGQVLPKIGDLPAVAERPLLKSPEWSGMHLGAWKIVFSFHESKSQDNVLASLKLEQVVEVRPDGQLITASKEIGEKDWEPGTEYELVPLSHGTVLDAEKTEDETIELLGKTWPCKKETRSTKYGDNATSTGVLWVPDEGETLARLRKVGKGALKSRHGLDYGGGSAPQITEWSLAEWSSGAPIGEKVYDCVRFEQYSYPGTKRPESGFRFKHEFINPDVPGGLVASVETGPKDDDFTVSACLAFGEGQDPVPSIEEIRTRLVPRFFAFAKQVRSTAKGLPLKSD